MIPVKYYIRLLFALMMQLLFFENAPFLSAWTHPYIYILPLLVLPVPVNRYAELLTGAVVGLIMDLCTNNLGANLCACCTLCFLRPLFLQTVQDIERVKGEISGAVIGRREYLRVAFICIVIHHTILFGLEAFTLHHLWKTLTVIILSSAITCIIAALIDLMKRKK